MKRKWRKTALMYGLAFCLTEALCLGAPMQAMAGGDAKEEGQNPPAYEEYVSEETPVYLAGAESDVRKVILKGLENLDQVIDVRGYGLNEENFPSYWDDVYYGEGTAFVSGLGVEYFMEGYNIAEIYPQYDKQYSKQDVQDYKDKREKVLADLIQPGMTDLQKALVLHDYVVSHVSYDLSGHKRRNAHDALVKQTAVYNGYVSCYMDLLRYAGVESKRIESSSMAHAWVAVKIDGNWYHVDCVKDDPKRVKDESKVTMSGPVGNHPAQGWPGRANHDFFLLSDEKLSETHYGWRKVVQCYDDTYDYIGFDETFWLESDRDLHICSPFVYVGSDNYTIKQGSDGKCELYRNLSEKICSINYPSSKGVYYSFLSYDNGYLIFNDRQNVYAVKPGEKTTKVVYTYTGQGDICGCLAEDGKAKLLILDSFKHNDYEYKYLTEDKTIEVTLNLPNVTPTVSGSVAGSLKTFGSTGDAVTIELLKSGSVVKTEKLAGTQTSYSLTNLAAGSYTLRVSKKGHVTREYAVTVGKTKVTQNVEISLRGDVDMSGAVDIGDHQRLFTHLQGTNVITDDYQKKIADTDESGVIDIGDHQRLFTHLQGTNPF